jgi:nucleoside-diphosphate-sugar epimerase
MSNHFGNGVMYDERIVTYVVTGALGCIGAWIVKTLVTRGDRVVMFDSQTDRHRLRAVFDDEDAAEAVPLVVGDLTDGPAVHRLLEEQGATHVIHLAGLQVPTCRANPPLGALVNVVGTLHVFEAARALGLQRVVYASSAAVFGVSEDDTPVAEDEADAPRTHYGWFKRTNEGNADIYYRDHGLSSVGLRPLTVYGVGRDTGITSDTTEALRHAVLGLPFHVRFGGTTDFLYVADCAEAFIACADRAPAGAHVFNLHGETAPVAEFVRLAETMLPEAAHGLIKVEGPPIPIASSLSDAALRRAVPGVPATDLRTGIAETLHRFTVLRDRGWWSSQVSA